MLYPEANCRGDNTAFFFSEQRAALRTAISLCNTCPHLTECRADALTRTPPPMTVVQGGLYFDVRGKPRSGKGSIGRGRPTRP